MLPGVFSHPTTWPRESERPFGERAIARQAELTVELMRPQRDTVAPPIAPRVPWRGVEFGDRDLEVHAWVALLRYLDSEVIPTLRHGSGGRRRFEELAESLRHRFPPGPRPLSPGA